MSSEDRLMMVLVRLEAVLAKLEESPASGSAEKREYFTTSEAAQMLGKAVFTVREWCRLGRVNSIRKESGRGPASEYLISADEIERIKNFGLLPAKD